MKAKYILLNVGMLLATTLTANISIHPPVGKVATRNTQMDVLGIERLNDVVPNNFRPNSPIQEEPVRTLRATTSTYTYQQLADMPVDQVVSFIVNEMVSIGDIPDLYQYNPGAIAFYGNADLMDALFNKLDELAGIWSPDQENIVKDIELLVEVIRAGPYLGFYYPDLKTLDRASGEMINVNDLRFKSRFNEPVLKMVSNEHFWWSNYCAMSYSDKSPQEQMMGIVGRAVGSGAVSLDIMAKMVPLVKYFNDNNFMRDPARADALWNLCGGLDYALYWDVVGGHGWNRQESQFYDHPTILAYVAELARLGLYGETYAGRMYVPLSAIYWLGYNTGLVVNDQVVVEFLQKCFALYERPSDGWLQIITSISSRYGQYFPEIDMAVLKKEIEAEVLPKRYVFEGGKRVFVTGDNVDEEKIISLYWATKEVRDKFQSLIQRDKPLNMNGTQERADSSLVAVVFNSPAEYKKYATFLYGIATNNGGMYIEGWGKFFTYERTIYESTLSLEDLFRHEFVHYLQGRYMCPGEWGASPLYTSDRLTWVEEGSAEFQAGSLRSKGVPHRATMVAGISDTPANRMTLPEVVRAKYSSGFTFYTYAYVAFHFMWDRHPELMFELYKKVQSGVVDDIEAFFTKFSTDYADEYLSYMQEIKNKQNEYEDPITPYDYYKNVTVRNENEVYAEISSLVGLTETQATTSESEYFTTFEISGKYVLGATSGNETIDRMNMEKKANEILSNVLTTSVWDGYKTTTARYIDYRVEDNQAVFDLKLSGLITQKEATGLLPNENHTNNLSNYPNPAQSNTNITFTTEQYAYVTLKVYDTMGRLVKTLIDGEKEHGRHIVNVDVSNLSNGTYVYTLSINGTQTSKMMVVNNR